MKVKVRSVGLVKQLLGQGELELVVPEGTAVSGLLRVLADEKSEKMAPFAVEPKAPSAHAPLRVMINGRDIQALEGRHTVLEEGDDVLIFVPIAGG
ncbi:MAG TPA: MoaD/ThiS family protein [Thermoleophilia bacterium]|nr:MoaD/ThiS family protein [Thermoleophilia bacterium]